MALLKQSLRSFKMANINPIFSIEYPNLDTLLFIRKQYPQMADMEIGTSIIDEECIIVHYLPADDKPVQIAEELIYFGTLLSSTKHFHRTDDQYDLVYRCVSLAHEAEESKTVEAFSNLGEEEKIKVKIELPKFERVSQIEVKCDRNDVLTITYPRDETVFSNVDFEARSTYFDLQTVVSNIIRDILKETFGVKLETRLFIGKNNVSFYIFDFNHSSRGTKFTMEKVVSDINGVLLKPEHRGKVEAKEVKAPEELLFVNQDDLKSTTLGDLLRQHFANSQQEEEQQIETSFTESEPDVAEGGKTLEVSFVDMGHPGPYTLEEVFAEIAKQDKSPTGEKPHTGFKPDEVVPLQGGEHSTCTSKQFDAGVKGFIVKEVKSEKFKSLLGHVDVAYEQDKDQLTITYPLDKTVLSTFNLSSADVGAWLENITSVSDSVRTIIKMEYNLKADVSSLVNNGKFKIYINDITRIAEDVEGVIKNIAPKINALILKPQFNTKHFA